MPGISELLVRRDRGLSAESLLQLAKWHYLASVDLYKSTLVHEARRQFTIADVLMSAALEGKPCWDFRALKGEQR